jgi:hypothetical protein
MGRVRFFGGKGVGAVRIGNHAGLADAETVVIGTKTYEWDNNASVVSGNVAVAIGTNAAADAVNLRDAINANPPTPPVTASIDPVDTATVRIIANSRGVAGNHALAKTMLHADNIISGAVMVGGENGGTQTIHRGEYDVTALDVAAGNVVIPTGLTSPRFPQVDVLTSTGAAKYITDKVTASGGNILIDADGATSLAAGDKVCWLAYE